MEAKEGKATHPCDRVYGKCFAGDSCPFVDAPYDCCVAFLKGKCRFGPKCKEPHVTKIKDNYVSACHPCVRVYGTCRYGENCEYANLPAESCIKFMKGKCTFGDQCRELHAMPSGHMNNYMSGRNYGSMGMGGYGMGYYGMGYGYGGMNGMGPLGAAVEAYADSGARSQKRVREDDGDDGSNKRQQPGYHGYGGGGGGYSGYSGYSGYPGYPAGGYSYYPPQTTHPCIRIYGYCRDGTSCRFANAPINVCLQHLKGNCKFAERCHEPHITLGETEPGKHPCVRVFGFCRMGDSCPYAKHPSELCLQYLKGRCKFAERCHEPHNTGRTGNSANGNSEENSGSA